MTTSPFRWAKDCAKLRAVAVLPSPVCALVTRITLGGLVARDSKIDVRSARYASARTDCGLSLMQRATFWLPAERELLFARVFSVHLVPATIRLAESVPRC